MSDVYLGRYDKWPKPLSRYSSANARGSRGGRKHTYDYYIRDDGSLLTVKVKGLTRLLPKGQKYKRKKFVCLSCGRASIQLVRENHKEDVLPCEYCDE